MHSIFHIPNSQLALAIPAHVSYNEAMHISSLIFNNHMACPKCRGKMAPEQWFDLPHGFYEFYCLNCGMRIWFRQEMLEEPIYLN